MSDYHDRNSMRPKGTPPLPLDKPKKRITGESVRTFKQLFKEAQGRPEYWEEWRRLEAVRDDTDAIKAAHREGWDAAIEAAIRAERKRVSIRALPYPGIAKAEGGSDGE